MFQRFFWLNERLIGRSKNSPHQDNIQANCSSHLDHFQWLFLTIHLYPMCHGGCESTGRER